MEGIYWFRIGAVGALLLGSVWILLPTFLRESAETRFASAASGVEAPAASSAQVDFELKAGAGDPVALSKVLEKRLAVGKVRFTSVLPAATAVEVTLGAGGAPEDVARYSRAPGNAKVYALDAVITLDPKGAGAADAVRATDPLATALTNQLGADADYWGRQAMRLVGTVVPQDRVTLPIDVASAAEADGGAMITWAAGRPFPPGVPLAAVAVDGKVGGVVFPDGAYHVVGDAVDVLALLISGPLPGTLADPKPVATPNAPGALGAGIPKAPKVESKVPAWLLAILPDTAITLGLDLQGGIDLTLQVQLEEAVLGQVSRDTTYLRDAAIREGVVIDNVRRSHSRPVIEITTDATLESLTEFLRSRASDYVYLDTENNVHRFEMSDARQEQVRDQSVEQVLETLRKRVDATGVKEPSIVKKSGGRINVQLPGLDDVQSAVDTISTTAVLEFKMVDEEFDDAYLEQVLALAEKEMPQGQFLDDNLLNIWLWDNHHLDNDRIIQWEYETVTEPGADTSKKVRLQPYPLVSEVVLTGNDVNDASVGWDQNQQAYVGLEFKPRGGQIFCDITTKSVGKRFGIILDRQVRSAPNIKERICGGRASIEMSAAEDPSKDAQTLALVLRSGALDAPVVTASVRQVGASLGADAIRGGSVAAAVGATLVFIFMILWYRTSGLIADIALAINITMILAALGLFGATLTLPGIAGIALTVGMAVDSNIIIYERIREELRLGLHPRKAVDTGFDKAIVAVLDANITTAIAGIVLYSFGTGPIKGFAVTLLIGIVTTLITAVFVTRTIMDIVTRSSAARLRI